MGIRVFDLLLDILRSIRVTIIITLPSGLTAALSGRAIDIVGTSEEKVVEEELAKNGCFYDLKK